MTSAGGRGRATTPAPLLPDFEESNAIERDAAQAIKEVGQRCHRFPSSEDYEKRRDRQVNPPTTPHKERLLSPEESDWKRE